MIKMTSRKRQIIEDTYGSEFPEHVANELSDSDIDNWLDKQSNKKFLRDHGEL
jgi:hypothetical protein